MLITTTPVLQDRRIVEYLGIVSGEAIMGANIVRDFAASITDIIGGRSGAYETKLKDAKRVALQEMEQEARSRGSNAILGVDLDYETVGGGGMLMVAASGTAVRYEEASA
ncbi:YbjQ family protein [bacterium]|nr:YbjQ family protein [bacterium]